MHPNPIFRKASAEKNIAFARERAFGTLAVNADDGPLISHVPFLLGQDGARLEAHLVRSNPIVRLLKQGPAKAVIAVQGGDSYVSPDWYGADNQVPTWNYVAVHLRGELRALSQEKLHGILERLSAQFETRIPGKPPWTSGKMDPAAYEKLLRMIVPVEMTVADIDGTWKLSQNKDAAMREGAAAGLLEAGLGQETAVLAGLMREVETD